MKAVALSAIVAVMTSAATVVHADSMAAMVSNYRREHGLSSVKADPQLTAIAERQAKAMAASGIMDHSVAGSFASRISGVRTSMAAENIAAGPHSWAETLRLWQASRGHNANLLQARADSIGVAVARNEQTRYKTFWAMVIADKSLASPKQRKVAALAKASPEKKATEKKATHENIAERRWGSSENPFSMVKSFVCRYLCQ